MITKFNNFLNEGISRTYDEYMGELIDEFIKHGVDVSKANDAIDYFHGKSYIEEMWSSGLSPAEAYQELKTYKYFK